MAVKASAAITVSIERDIQGTWRFYRIASSSSTPSTPTTAQGQAFVNSGTVPSGWSKVEPAYDGTSTNSLYTVDLTAFTDGSVVWTDVSKSSSYEAAKQAYNEAQNAKMTATNYVAELSNGVFVHAYGTPADPNNTDAKGVRITEDVDIIRCGASVANFGELARIGTENGSHLVFGSDFCEGIAGDGILSFKIALSGTTVTSSVELFREVYATPSSGHSLEILYDDSKLTDGDNVSIALFGVGWSYGTGHANTYGEAGQYHFESTSAGIGADCVFNGSNSFILSNIQTSFTELIIRVNAETNRNAPFVVLGAGSAENVYGGYSVSEGFNSTAIQNYSHAEGYATQTGIKSGQQLVAMGAHAEGKQTVSTGIASHSEGVSTTASDQAAHAEGSNTTASGPCSHAEGSTTVAGFFTAHAEGYHAVASGRCSHAQNNYTIASGNSQTAIGEFNVEDSSSIYALIIGNGNSENNRSNCCTVDWNGNIDIASGAMYKINGSDLSAYDVGAVPNSRAINGKPLSNDITLNTSDINNDSGYLDKTGILDLFYPVGSYYETSDIAFDPNTAWGGAWSLEAEGLVHIGAGSNYNAGDTGGEETVTLTAAQSGLPAHTHAFTQPTIRAKYSKSCAKGTTENRAATDGDKSTTGPYSASGGAVGAVTGGAKPASQAHNNMQPYVVVNRWHRTA